MFRAAIIAVLLSGCVHGPAVQVRRPTPLERDQVAAAVEAWELAELDELGAACASERETLRVAVAHSHEEMFSLTGYCGPSSGETAGTQWEGDLFCRWGRAAGAYRRARTGGVWPFALFEEDWPLIVVWGGFEERRRLSLVRHESVHFLEQCTGRGWNPWAPHDDEEVWCLDGCPGRYRRREPE